MTNLLSKGQTDLRIPPTPTVERVVQIGEGNFIRAFVDWLLQSLHQEGLFDGAVVLTPARASGAPKLAALQAQDRLFTVWTRGLEQGRMIDRTDVVSIVSRVVDPFEDWPAFLACAEQASIDIVVSNTTELGITYTPTPYPREAAATTFPARLATYLERRYTHFGGAAEAGLVILPTELIEDNAGALRRIVLQHANDWGLGADFARWVTQHNVFCNTLVDRIVPGFPDSNTDELWARLGYEDRQLAVAEPYYLWVIDAHETAMRRLPFHRSHLNVRYTDDLTPYRLQKLRILNGTHTLMAAPGLLLGLTTVRAAMTHPALGAFVRRTVEEVTVAYSELDAATLREYAAGVFDRFLNPAIEHRLTAIMLNSVGKFRIRLLPVLLRYHEARGAVPEPLCLSLAALLHYYDPALGMPLDDAPEVIATLHDAWESGQGTRAIVARLLADTALWEHDLTDLAGLVERVTHYIEAIRSGALESCLAQTSI